MEDKIGININQVYQAYHIKQYLWIRHILLLARELYYITVYAQ